MSEQDTSAPRPSEEDSEQVEPSSQTDDAGTANGGREDDRNEELPDSPAPDPEEGTQGAEDDPQAD
jgi:hypothetical protein